MLKKCSTCSSKFLNNFTKKDIVLNNGCNTIYGTISNVLAVGSYC